MRSLLLVPAHTERQLLAAAAGGADAVLVDLAAVLPNEKPKARQLVAACVRQLPRPSTVWVAVSSFDSDDLIEDLDALVGWQPAGIVLTGVDRRSRLDAACHYLAITESIHRIELHSTRVALQCAATAANILCLREISRTERRRIQFLIRDWSARGPAISSELAMLEQCVAAGQALGVPIVDDVFRGPDDRAALRHCVEAAATAGFTGKLASDLNQVEAIHRIFCAPPPMRRVVSKEDRLLRASA